MSGVPTPEEAGLMATLETVRETGVAHCRLCDEPVDVRDADGWGDVFEALAEHGQRREDHVWDDREGWKYAETAETAGDGQ